MRSDVWCHSYACPSMPCGPKHIRAPSNEVNFPSVSAGGQQENTISAPSPRLRLVSWEQPTYTHASRTCLAVCRILNLCMDTLGRDGDPLVLLAIPCLSRPLRPSSSCKRQPRKVADTRDTAASCKRAAERSVPCLRGNFAAASEFYKLEKAAVVSHVI